MACHQFNGLLIKNFNLLTKQKGTMICQIITPIICLAFVFLIQIIVQANIGKSAYGVKFDYPFFLNLPIYDRLQYSKLPIKITSCNEWYLYDFAADTPEEDKEFFGFNNGYVNKYTKERLDNIQVEEDIFYNDEIKKEIFENKSYNTTDPLFFKSSSSGLLTADYNIMQKLCFDYETGTVRKTPYFQQPNKTSKYYTGEGLKDEGGEDISFNTDINNELYYRLEELNKLEFSKIKQGIGLDVLPDGAILINRANKNEFSYNIQINDNKFPYYHKNNAVTLIKIFNPQSDRYTFYVNVLNGALWLADLMNRAYMKYFHPELYVVTGVQPMPFEIDNSENVQRLISIAGSTFYPLAISLLMPIFMYTIVLEKENKLVEIMKINGMKMTYYWLSLFTYNFIIYATTFIIFYLFGFFCFGFKLFTDTSFALLLIVFLGWGFCQIGLAYFFQAFLSNARTSTSKFMRLFYLKFSFFN